MARGNQIKYVFGGIVVFIIAAAVVILGVTGNIPGMQAGPGSPWGPAPGEQPSAPQAPPQDDSYWLTLKFQPDNMCVGGDTTAQLASNMPKGICAIFANTGSGWNFYGNVNLDSTGRYSLKQTINVVGDAIFRVTCCDTASNCKISNEAMLSVRDCDSDGDGWSNAEEIEAGTDPFDGGDYPGSAQTSCNDICISNGYASGRGPVATPDDCTGVETPYTDNFGALCCCGTGWTPPEESCYDNDGSYPYIEQYKTAGTCTDSLGDHADYCDSDGKLKEFTCLGSDVFCNEGLIACYYIVPDNSFCIFGACSTYDGGIYEDECQMLGYSFGYSADVAQAASGSCYTFSDQFCKGRNEIMLEQTQGTNVAEGFNFCCWTCST